VTDLGVVYGSLAALKRMLPRDRGIIILLDHFLAARGFESQQRDEPEDPTRPSNLWSPVEGHHAAHGDFDPQARDWSLQLWANLHRGWIGVGLLACAVLLGTWISWGA
jgi:hypothetical protein